MDETAYIELTSALVDLERREEDALLLPSPFIVENARIVVTKSFDKESGTSVVSVHFAISEKLLLQINGKRIRTAKTDKHSPPLNRTLFYRFCDMPLDTEWGWPGHVDATERVGKEYKSRKNRWRLWEISYSQFGLEQEILDLAEHEFHRLMAFAYNHDN
jgi:hypothetical protein